MARSGPLTKTPASLALGLAQIRVGSASENIATATPVLTEADSIGSLAQTKFTNEVEYWTHSSGFPLKTKCTRCRKVRSWNVSSKN